MSEEQAQQMLYQLQMLESYVADLTQREQTLMGIMREASASIESIKSLHEKPQSSTMVPIGMGTYVKTEFSSENKVVLNIGAGIAIEKDKDSAINYLEARLKEIEVAIQDTSAKRQEATQRLEQGKQQINMLMQQGAPPNKP